MTAKLVSYIILFLKRLQSIQKHIEIRFNYYATKEKDLFLPAKYSK